MASGVESFGFERLGVEHFGLECPGFGCFWFERESFALTLQMVRGFKRAVEREEAESDAMAAIELLHAGFLHCMQHSHMEHCAHMLRWTEIRGRHSVSPCRTLYR